MRSNNVAQVINFLAEILYFSGLRVRMASYGSGISRRGYSVWSWVDIERTIISSKFSSSNIRRTVARITYIAL